jgi:glucokinase
MTFALGIDLGGSSVKAAAVTPDGKLLAQTNVPFDVNERFDWARRIQQIVSELDAATQASLSPQREEGLRVRGDDGKDLKAKPTTTDLTTPHPVEGRGSLQASAIGISAPGLAARDGRSIARMPGRLHGLEGLDWSHFLNAERGTGNAEPEHSDTYSAFRAARSAFVPVLNDAHAALLGEAWLGAARGFKNVFMLTLGTGVGGAAIVDGRLLKGALGRAGHLGHVSLDLDGPRDVCGMPGSLEALVGNYSIEERTAGRFKTTHDLVSAHARGDAFATEVWLKSVRALGYAISSLVNVLDPEAVIIGGGIARSGAALFEPLERFMRDTEWNVGAPVKILPAELGELAGAYGAAWNALKETHALS